MSTKPIICDRCRGRGHDKGGMPIINKIGRLCVAGVMHPQKHITVKRGSGCLKCLGRGVL